MGSKRWRAVLRLKKALGKLKALLRLHLASRRRLPSTDLADPTVRPRPRPPPPHPYGVVGDDVDEDFIDDSLRQTYEIVEEDVDQQAQNFIDEFHRGLCLERLISQRLRYYYRSSSYGTDDEDGSPPPPPPPPPLPWIL